MHSCRLFWRIRDRFDLSDLLLSESRLNLEAAKWWLVGKDFSKVANPTRCKMSRVISGSQAWMESSAAG